jgi:ectoine hydroxylase-related dioxygenase (phytanoyl-CoA dioxygenase family)
VLTGRHELGGEGRGIERLGILVEPASHPSCTPWHRDLRETSGVPDVEEFRRMNPDPLCFNQFNCPLYEDNCTWYVPGSYLRSFDLPGETAVGMPPEVDASATNEEREQTYLAYCHKMPGSIRASMDAGDFMLYHPNAWHLGNYAPYRKRVTFHGFAPSPELIDWYARWHAKGAAAAKATKAA